MPILEVDKDFYKQKIQSFEQQYTETGSLDFKLLITKAYLKGIIYNDWSKMR